MREVKEGQNWQNKQNYRFVEIAKVDDSQVVVKYRNGKTASYDKSAFLAQFDHTPIIVRKIKE